MPLKCENIMADDIRENAMAGGTPARLRGLDANGNSISPTIQEVAETFGKGYAADLNNETDYGISGMFNADTINHPPISSDTFFGIYSNHRAKYITGGVFLYQIAVPENMIGMYVRRCWNGYWSEWKSITLT